MLRALVIGALCSGCILGPPPVPFAGQEATLVTGVDSSGEASGVAIVISAQTSICAELKTSKGKPTSVTLQLVLTPGSGAVLQKGTYKVGATGAFHVTGFLRRPTGALLVTSGTVTVDTVKALTDATGSFSLVLGDQGETAKGNFTVTACEGADQTVFANVGGDICARVSACPNDPPPDVASCRPNFKASNPCKTVNTDFSECYFANQICGEDGKTNSAQLGIDCRAETQAAATCH